MPSRELVPSARGASLSNAALQRRSMLRGVSVLVVDDDEDALDLLGTMLGLHGAEVRLASSSREALHLVRGAKPDVIVSDLSMPGEDGFAFLDHVRTMQPEDGGRTPAVALSGYTRQEDRARAFEAGYAMHVAKPVDFDTLLDAIARVSGKLGAPEE